MEAAEITVISDVHLIDMGDSRARLLLAFLENFKTAPTRYLVLLGDVCDFCFGPTPYFKQKFSILGEALSELSNAGVQVLVFEGNHEFFLKDIGWSGVTFCDRRPHILTLSHGEKVLFAHGDLVGSPWHYHLYSGLVRSWPIKILARLFPQRLFDRLCLALSATSRKSQYGRQVDHRSIVSRIDRWSESYDTHHLVVGHFHAPYDVPRSNRRGRIWCLPSWDQPNVLQIGVGGIRRLRLGESQNSTST